MRFFLGDAIPDLSVSRHELPQPWVLPCTLPRDHKDRLCVLLLSALRGREPQLSALQLTWLDRARLARGALRLSATTLVQWQLAPHELLPELPAHFGVLSELPPHLPLLDLDLPPSPRHVRFAERHPGLGWLGALKVALLDQLQSYLSEQPTPSSSEIALALNDLAMFLPSPIELLDCLQVMLSYDQQDLPLFEARTEALGRVFADRFMHALGGGLSLRQALAALRLLPAVLAQRATPVSAETPSLALLPEDLYHLLLAMGLHEGPPDAASHPACALLREPATLDRTRQRIAEKTQPEEDLDEELPLADEEEVEALMGQAEAEPDGDAAFFESYVAKLLKERETQPESDATGFGIWLALKQWDANVGDEPVVSERIAIVAEQVAEWLKPEPAQEALMMAGKRWRKADRLNEAERALLRARQLAHDLGRPTTEAWAALELGQVWQELRRFPEAQESLEQARELYRQQGNGLGEALALHFLGRNLEELHHFDAARDHFTQALEVSAKLGNFRLASSAAGRLAFLALDQLGLEDAASAARVALKLASQARDQNLTAGACHLLGIVRLCQHRLGSALRWCERARVLFVDEGNLDQLPQALCLAGAIALHRGHSGDAHTAFMQAHALATQIDDRSDLGNARLGLAAVYLRSRQLDAAERELAQAYAFFVQTEDEQGRAEALRGQALVALLRGSEWRDLLQRADALAETAADLYGQWLGRLLRASAEQDAVQLAAVRDFFHSRGMPYESRLAAQLLPSDAPAPWPISREDTLRTLPFF